MDRDEDQVTGRPWMGGEIMIAAKSENWAISKQTSQELEMISSGAAGGIFLILCGLIFGGIPSLILITSILNTSTEGPEFVLIIFSLVGALMIIGGICLLFSKTTVVFDKARKNIAITAKSLSGEQAEDHSFDEVQEILYAAERSQRSKGSTYTMWVVDLVMQNGNTFRLGVATGEEKMRNLGEMLAKLLDVPLKDITGEEEVVRFPEELDKSLAEKIRDETEIVERATDDPPHGSRIRLERTGNEVRYLLPAAGLISGAGCLIFFMLMWTGFAVFWTLMAVAAVLTSNSPGPLFVFPLFGLPFILVGFGMLFSIVRGCLGNDEIVINPGTIITNVVLLGSRTGKREIPLTKVEEVKKARSMVPFTSRFASASIQCGLISRYSAMLSGRGPIMIVSDQAIMKVGSNLGPEDYDWLHNSIRYEIYRMSGR